MERSYAFGQIDDPADPAWGGHAELRRSWWRAHARVLAATLIALAIIACVGFAVRLSDGDAAPPTVTKVEPSRSIVPAVPRLSAADAVAAAEVQPAKPPVAAVKSSEYQLSREEIRAASYSWATADGETQSTFGRPGAVVGDTNGLGPSIRAGLEGLAVRMDTSLTVISGTRTRAEQAVLYRRFQAGQGNLAAPPGSSRHETGEAADVYVDGVPLAEVPGAIRHAAVLSLGFPVPGEAWHIERRSARG